MKWTGNPIVAPGEEATTKCETTAGATAIVALPNMLLTCVSVADRIWLPAVFNVTLNVPLPLVKVTVPSGAAWPSPLVN